MISYLHCYVNSRASVDWNTCGQAAIATITDYWGRNPYGLPRTVRDSYNGRYYWNDGQAIDTIKSRGYGPDVVFGWGTTGGRIRDALRSYGLNASVGHSGFASWGWDNLWRQLQNYIYWNRPVPVLVDIGRLGGPAFGAHWAIAYRTDGSRIYLGNMSWSWNATPTYDVFLGAWQAWFLPYGFNHCAVYS